MTRPLARAAALAAALALPALAAAAESARPNILFVFADDLPHRAVSAYEEAWPWVRTPRLDRLAREGVRFEHAYSGPWCAPSRAMMMTGRQLHAVAQPQRLRNNEGVAPVWTDALRRAGYRTGIVGKWDLPPGLPGTWDRSVIWRSAGGPGWDPVHYYRGMSLEFDGGAPRKVEGYATDLYTQYAADFIRANTAQPWFLWLCYGAPHVPTIPAERHRNLYADAQPALTDERDMFGPRENVPRHQRTRSEVTRNGARIERSYPPGMAMTDLMRNYGATVAAIDEGVGALLDALAATGQLERTIVVFTADDGMPFGEHGFVNKQGPYDACQRVPLIVRGPAALVARGAVCRRPVGALDLIPTFLAAAGIAPPHALHGHDLAPLLRDPAAPWPHATMLQAFGFEAGSAVHSGVTNYPLRGNTPSPEGIPWWLMLRRDRFKYIRTLVRDEIEELYDLAADPGERRNLAVDPRHRAPLREMRAALDAELRRTEGAKLADNLPAPVEIDRPSP